MRLSKYVNNTYKDKLTIIRYINIDNDDGTTGEKQDLSPELVDIPCRLSLIHI